MPARQDAPGHNVSEAGSRGEAARAAAAVARVPAGAGAPRRRFAAHARGVRRDRWRPNCRIGGGARAAALREQGSKPLPADGPLRPPLGRARRGVGGCTLRRMTSGRCEGPCHRAATSVGRGLAPGARTLPPGGRRPGGCWPRLERLRRDLWRPPRRPVGGLVIGAASVPGGAWPAGGAAPSVAPSRSRGTRLRSTSCSLCWRVGWPSGGGSGGRPNRVAARPGLACAHMAGACYASAGQPRPRSLGRGAPPRHGWHWSAMAGRWPAGAASALRAPMQPGGWNRPGLDPRARGDSRSSPSC